MTKKYEVQITVGYLIEVEADSAEAARIEAEENYEFINTSQDILTTEVLPLED